MAKFCPKCGKELNEGVKFCPGCGAPIPVQVNPAGGQPGGQAGAPMGGQPMNAMPVQRRQSSNRTLIIAGVAAVVVIILIIFGFMKLFGSNYEDPIKNLVKTANKGDEKAVQKIFVPDYTDEILENVDAKEFAETLQDSMDGEKVDYDITDEEKIDKDSFKKKLNKYAPGWEEYVDIEDVSGMYLLDIELESGDDTDDANNVVVIKVDGDWYLLPSSFYMSLF